MKKIYHKIIIGSGPSAIGGILGLKDQNYKTIVVTGNEKKEINKINFKKVHKKISFENNISKLGNFFFNKSEALYSICDIGGFGNYWGQGSEYVKYKNLYNKSYFKSNKDYQNIIKFLYNIFKISVDDHKIELNIGKLYSSPILENSINKSNTGLNSFKETFNFIVKKKKIRVLKDKVIQIRKSKNFFKLNTKLGKEYYCKKVFLAAGALGNSKILLNSDDDINNLSFFDDCPWLIYALNLNKKLKSEASDKTSLIFSKLNKYFLSFYNMSKIKLSFFIFYFFNIKINFFNHFKCSSLNFFSFIQLWASETNVEFLINKSHGFKIIANKKNRSIKNFKKKLIKDKIFPLRIMKTKPGHGFHYHNLLVHKKNNKINIQKYLKFKFKKNIFCIDSSIIEKINPGPFTITQMAISYNIMKKNDF